VFSAGAAVVVASAASSMTGSVDAEEKRPLVAAADAEKGVATKQDAAGASFHLLVQQYKIPLIILYYGLCSSTLIVINKVAVHNITVSALLATLMGLVVTLYKTDICCSSRTCKA